MINVPASMMTALDRIAFKNDLEQEFIINSMTPGEPKVFNVVIVSGNPEETNNMSEGTAYGKPKSNNSQEPSYYFARVRRENVDALEKPDPFLAKDRSTAMTLANMHPIGALLSGEGKRAPLMGEIWSARYLTKDRRGIILNGIIYDAVRYSASCLSYGFSRKNNPGTVKLYVVTTSRIGVFKHF